MQRGAGLSYSARMQIDRARFLFLTTTLAATTALTFTGGLGGCSKTDTTTDGGGTETDASNADSSVDSSIADASDASTGDATTCLDDDGVAPNCDSFDGGAMCSVQCGSVSRHLKHQVAVKAAGCIDMNMNVSPTCEGGSPACVEAALASACDDPTAAPFCADFVPKCEDAGAGADGGVFTQAECVTFVRGLNAGGRAALTDQGCFGLDLIRLGQ